VRHDTNDCLKELFDQTGEFLSATSAVYGETYFQEDRFEEASTRSMDVITQW